MQGRAADEIRRFDLRLREELGRWLPGRNAELIGQPLSLSEHTIECSRIACAGRVYDHRHMKQRARRHLAMRIARARSGERLQRSILRAYVKGFISRGTVMQTLGLDWYGDLCDLIARAGLRIELSASAKAVMEASLAAVFPQGLDLPTPPTHDS